ncbi:succinylglutamate desuccinylase/aspartoacylase [Chondrocystis sp. NIES-4102]|nr:succinylglutamate desuccinylase/aspartoacylase [Chondrocystis sp. NIES-4102]
MIPSISTIDLLQLASGDFLSLQVYKFVGKQSGKKAYIQANLHGGEIVGNAVIHQLIEWLITLDESQLLGEIWLVPVCNPLGVNQRSHFFSTGRFNSYDGKNWNRIFWDYEKIVKDLTEFAQSQLELEPATIRDNYLSKIKQAWQAELESIRQFSSAPISKQYRYQLQSLCLDADYVIDIHSSSNLGINYTFGFKERSDSTKYLLLDYGILMDEYDGDAFDEAFLKPWLALETELANLGRPIKFDIESWTLELGGGMVMNPISIAKGLAGIKNYLAYKQILSLSQPIEQANITLVSKSKIKSYYAPAGGMIQARLPLESRINSGDLVYQLLSFNKQAAIPKVIDIFAENKGIVFDLSTNHCVNQGEYVMDILEE